MGNYDYFGYAKVSFNFMDSWPCVLAIGVSGGIFGGIFTRIVINGEPYLRSLGKDFGKNNPVIFAAICGFGIAVLGYLSGGLSFGSGYAMGHDLIHATLTPQWWQMPAKFFATVFSAISGIPGGIFSPSLSFGASMGGEIGQWFPATGIAGAVILGMVAYFAGVTQAPITAFVIVLEITGSATEAVPLIAAAVIATGFSRMISPHSLYHALAKRFVISVQEKA